MKAVIYKKYGPPEVLQLTDKEIPQPGDNEVLIKILATTVTPADWRARSLKVPSLLFKLPARIFFGMFKPKREILGTELAGVIEVTGKNVKRFKRGDQVFVGTGADYGAHCQYISLPADSPIVHKPENVGFEEAAAVPLSASTALFFLKNKGNIQKGQRVLIYGASGAIGTYAVQLASYFGAEVTGVCSGKNTDLIKSLGADHAIDYTKEDYTDTDNSYDIVFDTVGMTSFRKCRNILAPEGRFLTTVIRVREIMDIICSSISGRKKVQVGVSEEKEEYLLFFKKLMEENKLKTVIDRTYSIDSITEAHRYAESGHKTGNLIVLPHDSPAHSQNT